ncbi:hypothetical protein [Alsobacter sp. R-9]
MRSLVLLAAVGVSVMVLAAVLSGRRAAVMGAAAVAAGLAVCLAAVLSMDCTQCHTASLAVGFFVSAPFFLAGWIILFVVGHGPESLAWRVAASVAAVLQLGWAAPAARAALSGRCPCDGLPWIEGANGLAAVGIDRWAMPFFAVAALLSLYLLGRRTPTGRDPASSDRPA